MAFTGAATIKVVSQHQVRITGLSLGSAATGTIGLHQKTVAPDVRLPASFQPKSYNNAEGHKVTIADAVDCRINKAAADANSTQYSVVKTGGLGDGDDFAITITNLVAAVGPLLELYVFFYGG